MENPFTVILDYNASSIVNFSHQKYSSIMKDTVTLSKYFLCYYKWKQIKDRFQLEW